MSKKVLLISGSDRNGSFNTQLVEILSEKLNNKGIETEILDYSNVPLLSQNTEYPTPQAVADLREAVKNSDALFVISPEYNGSYSARLKNLMDWLSRPAAPELRDEPTVIGSKKVAFGSVANSTYGKFVRKNLSELLAYVRMNVIEGEGLGIIIPGAAWQTGLLKPELEAEQQQLIDEYVDTFIKFIG